MNKKSLIIVLSILYIAGILVSGFTETISLDYSYDGSATKTLDLLIFPGLV